MAARERDDVGNNDNRIHILLLLLSNRASVSIIRCKMNVRDNSQATNVDVPWSTAFYFLFSFLHNKILVFDANMYKNRICGDSSNGKVVHWTWTHAATVWVCNESLFHLQTVEQTRRESAEKSKISNFNRSRCVEKSHFAVAWMQISCAASNSSEKTNYLRVHVCACSP